MRQPPKESLREIGVAAPDNENVCGAGRQERLE